MSDQVNKAVFLSYASQDAAAVERIAEALRAAGIEVWFDKNELVGGDAWDQKIRRQIKECAIFVPVISANTDARAEGYFRLEWKLAVDRSHLMADDAAFLFPVVIDDTSDAAARVPDRFRDFQWTRLNVKDTPETLARRVSKVLGGGSGRETERPRRLESSDAAASRRKSTPEWFRLVAMVGGLAIGLVYAFRPMWESPPRTREAKPPVAEKSFAPAPKLSEARQLGEKARALFDKIDSNADDFAIAESLLKRALELDATDGVIWAYSARLNSAYLTRNFERGTARAEASRSQAERAVKLAPDSAEAWHALGRSLFLTDRPQAEEALRHAIQLAPNDGRILLSLGSVCRLQNRLDEALAFYVQAAAQPDVKSLALYDQFLIHLYLRRFAEADRCVREAIAELPTTNNLTGRAMLEIAWRGDLAAAQHTLAEAPAAMRAEPRMVFISALVALMARQTDEALRALDRLPGDFINDAWYSGPKALLVGLAHTQAGRPEAARIAWEAGVSVVRRRLQESANDAELHLRLGELLAWSGRADEALHEARAFEELARDRPPDWTFSSARIYAALGRADEALPILEKFLVATASGRWPLTPAVLRLDPLWSKLRDDPRFQTMCAEPAPEERKTGASATPPSEAAQLAARALALIVKVGFTRDDLAPAEDFARRATEKEPDSAAAWGVRAGVQAAWIFRNWDSSEKRRQDTQTFANHALALDPNEPEALLALGHVLRRQGAFEQAEALLRRAIAANPNHVRLARALGFTLSGHGRNAEGRVVLQELVRRVPRDPLVRYELATTYGSYGPGGGTPENFAGVLEQLDAALALQPFSSALVMKAALVGGWRGDLPAMRAVLDQLDRLPLAERSEDRSVAIAMWAGVVEHRPDRVEAAAALTARNYFDDSILLLHPKSWSLALAHRLAGKDNTARADWQAAEAVLRQRIKDDPDNMNYPVELAATLAWLGQREEAARLVGAIEPVWKEGPTPNRSRLLALYYAALGDAARAAPYLPQTIDQSPFTSRQVVPLDPWWDKIRGAPEFAAALQPAGAKK
jgi:tetratricopeptide (TPR) repeat protein